MASQFVGKTALTFSFSSAMFWNSGKVCENSDPSCDWNDNSTDPSRESTRLSENVEEDVVTIAGVVVVVAILVVMVELIVVIETEEEDDSRAVSCLEFSFKFNLSEDCSWILIFCCSSCYKKKYNNISLLMTNPIFIFFFPARDTIPVVPIHVYVFSYVSDNWHKF